MSNYGDGLYGAGFYGGAPGAGGLEISESLLGTLVMSDTSGATLNAEDSALGILRAADRIDFSRATPPTRTLAVAGVVSGEALGVPKILHPGGIAVDGIASGETLGRPLLTVGKRGGLPLLLNPSS